jgi:uncharacterized protein YbaR (Trm112 family)
MISPELLELLVCPETRQSLAVADDELVARLNRAIEARQLKNKVGQPLEKTLDGALVREDGRVVYPVQDGIPVMLVDDGILLEQLPA